MTPKEKAADLVSKFTLVVSDGVGQDGRAKKCALVLVDEILAQDSNVFDLSEAQYHFEYWGNVKDALIS